MKFIFWGFLSLVAFVYFGYPIILFIVSLVAGKKFKKEQFLPNVTILIPAHNEGKVISKKLDNCFSLDCSQDKLEVILILDACTDNTESIALSHKAPGLRIVKQKERKGKIAALNLAIPQAKGEIIVFTDANSMYEKDALKKLIRNFSDEKVGCACGELKYVLKDNTSVEVGENLYWKYEKFLKVKESDLGSLLITNGSIYAIRKKLYEPIDEDLADDFVNPMKIAKKGFLVVYEPEAIAIEKVSSAFKDQFNQKVRIVSQGWKATFRLWSVIFGSSPLRIFEFLFHKFFRWMVPFFLIVIFISNLLLASIKFYQVLFIVQLLFYAFAFMGYLFQKKGGKIKLFYIPFYFCMVNATSLLALFKYLKGGETGIWEKSQTSRR